MRIIRLFLHLATLALLFLLSYRLVSNLAFMRWARQHAKGRSRPQPRVSVLVPARNEEATIVSCVASLLAQKYPDYEVIVLDDASTDQTGPLLDALAGAEPRLKVIHAKDDLPAGWNGKSYACHRLAKEATGEWLLFTDADTLHSPQSLELGVAQAIALNVDLLSAFPVQVTQTWSERILVSFIVDFLPLVGLDFRSIYLGKGMHSAANGQYLLARSSAYGKVGGHAAVSSETLDDFALAKQFRLEGHKIALIDGKELLSCRMYHNVHEVWEGFSRSLMHGLDHSSLKSHSLPWALLFAWGYSALFVNPFYSLFFARNAGHVSGHFSGQKSGQYSRVSRWLALVEICGLALLRGMATWHLRRPLLEIVTTPLAAWGVIALGLAALYRRWQGQKVNWKGRYYSG